MDRFCLFLLHVGVCCAVVSVPCSLLAICWKRADLLAIVFLLSLYRTSELRARLAP